MCDLLLERYYGIVVGFDRFALTRMELRGRGWVPSAGGGSCQMMRCSLP
jgi:hypothetical protein